MREYERTKTEIDNALMSCNLQIDRASSELARALERKRQLQARLTDLERVTAEYYWRRLLTWATTGRLV